MSLLIGAGVLMSLPFVAKNLIFLIGVVVLIGVAQSISFGSFFQLVAIFPEKCMPFLFMGNGMSSALLLALSYGLGLLNYKPSEPLGWKLYAYFGTIAGLLGICFVFFVILMNSAVMNRILAKMNNSSKSGSENSDVPLISEYNDSTGYSFQSTKELTTCQLIVALKLPLMSIFISLFSTVLVLTFYSYIPSSCTIPSLTQILNYVTLLSDFLGRQLVLMRKEWLIRNNFGVFVSVLIRLCLTIFFFIYIVNLLSWRNDIFILVFIALYAMMGGYSNTLIYTYSNKSGGIPASQNAKSTSIINIVLQLGVFAAIPMQFIFAKMIPALPTCGTSGA